MKLKNRYNRTGNVSQNISQCRYSLKWIGLLFVVLLLNGCGSSPKVDDRQPTPAKVNKMETDTFYKVCPGMKVSNAPRIDSQRNIIKYQSHIKVNGVWLALVPLRGGCLSSGFGPRGNGFHKGVDFHQRPAKTVYAAADGKILEREFYKTYGNMVVIDHGSGVYTRYAHLKNFARGIKVNAIVKAGDALGIMGNTSTIRLPVNLHYELLIGDYNNPKKAYGLKPQNPFNYVN